MLGTWLIRTLMLRVMLLETELQQVSDKLNITKWRRKKVYHLNVLHKLFFSIPDWNKGCSARLLKLFIWNNSRYDLGQCLLIVQYNMWANSSGHIHSIMSQTAARHSMIAVYKLHPNLFKDSSLCSENRVLNNSSELEIYKFKNVYSYVLGRSPLQKKKVFSPFLIFS